MGKKHSGRKVHCCRTAEGGGRLATLPNKSSGVTAA